MPTNAEHQAAWRRRQKEKIAALTEAQTRIRALEEQLDAARARIQELETVRHDRASQTPELNRSRPRGKPDPLAKYLYPTPMRPKGDRPPDPRGRDRRRQ